MAVYCITGATGYIGSMLVKHIGQQEGNDKIIALVRNRDKAQKLFPAGVDIIQWDLSGRISVKEIKTSCDYIIHCASCTQSSEMTAHPVEVIKSIVNTTQSVLELAGNCGIKSMVYLSSMEVYGRLDCSDGHKAAEEELGDIAILNARSCYPLGKRMAENI